MNANDSVQLQRMAFWSPLYLTAILYPVVMGIPLYACWLWLAPMTFFGVAYWYVAASLGLAAALYLVVRLWGWWETPRLRRADRPLISWAERICRIGKLGEWDGALSLGLLLACVLLLLMTPSTDAETLLPAVGLLMVGSLANLLRPELEDKQEVQRRVKLIEKRQARQMSINRARLATGEKRAPTLRLPDVRREEVLENAETVILHYRWSYAPYSSAKPVAQHYEAELPVNMEHYREFRRLDHGEQGSLGEGYASRPLAVPDEEIKELAWELELLAREASFGTLNTAGLALALVQSIPYNSDREATGQAEYARYPLETLVDGKGNGDCHAILAAALLARLGFDVLLVYLPQVESGRPEDAHLGVAVAGREDIPGDQWYRFEGRKYYFVETTSPSARLGEFPQENAVRDHYPLPLR